MYKRGIDTKEFNEKLMQKVLYSSSISRDDVKNSVTITMKAGDEYGKNWNEWLENV